MPDWNPAEMIGIHPKPLALSLYRELITNTVWANQRRAYGYRDMSSNQLMTTFLGTPYIDIRVDFNSWIPSTLPNKLAEKLIGAYGKKIKYMGETGSGQLTKIINQICIAGLIQGLSEAVYFMKQTDLNVDDVLEVISSGAAQSWQLDNRLKTMVEDKFDFGFAVDLMRKDLGIAFNQASEFGIDLEVTKIVDQFYADLQEMGHNKLDTSSLLKRLLR